jgi:hypothetical protein
MRIVQGRGLRFIVPLVAAFFAGSVWLSIASARRRLVPRWSPWLHALALGSALAGGLLARGPAAQRLVGLAVLGVVAGAQAQVGVALWRRREATA